MNDNQSDFTDEELIANGIPAHAIPAFRMWQMEQATPEGHARRAAADAALAEHIAQGNAELAKKPSAWFWCLHCERVCQAKQMRKDFLGAMARCPHDDCDGCGVGVDMHEIGPDGTFFGDAKVPSLETLMSGQLVPLYPK